MTDNEERQIMQRAINSSPGSVNKLFLQDVRRRWPHSDIPYSVSCDFSQTSRAFIAFSLDEIEKLSCVKFTPAMNTDSDYINIYTGSNISQSYDDHLRIILGQTGCFADLGYYGPGHGAHRLHLKEPAGSWDPNCIYTFVIIHELFHSLGVAHEQTRPDRDNYMKINWNKMQLQYAYANWKGSYSTREALSKPRCTTSGQTQETANFDNCVSGYIFTDFGVPYDWSSIMHYGLN